MSFTRLCAILFVHQLEKKNPPIHNLYMSLLVFLKSDFFSQTEYERRGEVIVDFNDLL